MIGADPHLANVFEDDNGIRRESGFLRRIAQIDVIREADFIPGGYGVCWHRWDTAEAICALMPWHLLIGAVYRLYHTMRRGFGLADARQAAAYNSGRQSMRQEMQWARADFQRKLAEAELRAYERGVRAVTDDILRELHRDRAAEGHTL